jgi:hypothetical protein
MKPYIHRLCIPRIIDLVNQLYSSVHKIYSSVTTDEYIWVSYSVCKRIFQQQIQKKSQNRSVGDHGYQGVTQWQILKQF